MAQTFNGTTVASPPVTPDGLRWAVVARDPAAMTTSFTPYCTKYQHVDVSDFAAYVEGAQEPSAAPFSTDFTTAALAANTTLAATAASAVIPIVPDVFGTESNVYVRAAAWDTAGARSRSVSSAWSVRPSASCAGTGVGTIRRDPPRTDDM